jgi:hypothetical protein
VQVGWFRLSTDFKEQLREHLSRFGHDFRKNLFPIRYFALALAAATPEEITGMCHAAWRDSSQLLGYIRRNQYVNRSAGLAFNLGLIEKKRIVVAHLAFG